MAEESLKLKEYRKKLFTDVYSGIIPERVPIANNLTFEFLVQYAKKDLIEMQYDLKYEKIYDLLEQCKDLMRADDLNGILVRNPLNYMFEESSRCVMSDTGFLQYPNRAYMEAEEYDAFIENPYDYYYEHVQPHYMEAYKKSPTYKARAFAKRLLLSLDTGAQVYSAISDFTEKYEFCSAPAGSVSCLFPPYDFIADFVRGFENISVDIRRIPEKVKAADNALMPFCIYQLKPAVVDILGGTTTATHMPGFMSYKQFEEFYFKECNILAHLAAKQGLYSTFVLEHDWTRFIDLLQELPQGTRFSIEYGDMKKFKDKLGGKFVLSSMYPLDIIAHGKKQECLDYAKKTLDILASGGNYVFGFDKAALRVDDINLENYHAVMDFVLDYGKYANAGEKSIATKREDSISDFSGIYPEFKSDLCMSYQDFKRIYKPINDTADNYMREAYNKYSAIVNDFMWEM